MKWKTTKSETPCRGCSCRKIVTNPENKSKTHICVGSDTDNSVKVLNPKDKTDRACDWFYGKSY